MKEGIYLYVYLYKIQIMQGVYKIENKITKKIYIGSSYDISRRWTDHIYLLNKGIHHSVHLQKSWNKYGSTVFTFNIIEECSDILNREQHYLDTLLKADDYIKGLNKDFLKLGYNIKPKAENNKGYKCTEESIIKMLKSKGYDPILAIDNKGTILKEFVSTGYASKFYNIKPSVVRKSIKNKSTCKTNLNLGFIYKKDYFFGYKPLLFKPWNKGLKSNKPSSNIVSVYVYDLNDNLVNQFNSLKDCALYYNMEVSNIHKRINKIPKFDKKASKLYKLRLSNTLL